MPRKHNYIGGIIGADPLPSGSLRPGVSNLGSLGGDGATTTRPTRRWGGITGRSLVEGTAGYAIDHSLQFDGSADYLSRSQDTPDSDKKWTWAGWVKQHSPSASGQQNLLGGGSTSSSSDQGHIQFIGYRFGVRKYTTVTGFDIDTYTSSEFDDATSWNHFVIAYDSELSTPADRVKIWANGVPETTLVPASGASSVTYPDENEVILINGGANHKIGRRTFSGAYWFDGQLAENHFIDGQALTASDFGEFVGGTWYSKAYTGTYGNNGFYLDFGNPSALGTDVSGKGNNFSVTSIATSDQLTDVPSSAPTTYTTPTTGVLSLAEDYQSKL